MAQNDLINEIRATVQETVNAMNPPRLIPGTVTQASPLKISVDQKLELNEKSLIVPGATELKRGDHVVMLRDFGGGSYFVLGVI